MPDIFIGLVVLLFSVIIHEVSHGYVAYYLGDPTAHLAKRLTMNPLAHIDLIGTLLVPIFLLISGSSFLFGWAKPVPYNVYNLKGKYAESFVAFAGVLSNIVLAVVFGLLFRFGGTVFPLGMLFVFQYIVFINILLATVNLIPIPPLDGSKVLSGLLPFTTRMKIAERVGRYVNVNNVFVLMGILFILAFFLLPILYSVTHSITSLLLGIPTVL